MVGDAVGVEAFDEFFNIIGHRNLFLFDDLEILDHDQCGCRRNKGDLIDLIAGKILVPDLDDPFFSHLLAFKVGPEQDLVFDLVEVQDLDYLEYVVAWDMVDDGPVFDGGYLQLFS